MEVRRASLTFTVQVVLPPFFALAKKEKERKKERKREKKEKKAPEVPNNPVKFEKNPING